MREPGEPRATVIVHAPRRAFAPGVPRALKRLGYALVSPAEGAARADEEGPRRPALRIVDDRELDSVPVETGPEPLPILLLTRHRGPAATDFRAIGSVRRRAGLQPVYDVIQRLTETHPRAAPRVATDLPVQACGAGRYWAGSIRCLSERGCRVHGARGLEEDLRVELTFPVPGAGMLALPAQARGIRGDEAVLVFRSGVAPIRGAIARYVAQSLGRGASKRAIS